MTVSNYYRETNMMNDPKWIWILFFIFLFAILNSNAQSNLCGYVAPGWECENGIYNKVDTSLIQPQTILGDLIGIGANTSEFLANRNKGELGISRARKIDKKTDVYVFKALERIEKKLKKGKTSELAAYASIANLLDMPIEEVYKIKLQVIFESAKIKALEIK